MNPIGRFIVMLVCSMLRPRISLDEEIRQKMIVFPNDLDMNLHMNNARYLALTDIVGIGFLIQAGIWAVARRRRLVAVIGGRIIRHRFGLRVFESFAITTRFLCCDEKWFYFSQKIETERGTAAIVLTKGLVIDRRSKHSVRPDEILKDIAPNIKVAPISPEVAQWIAAERLLRVPDET